MLAANANAFWNCFAMPIDSPGCKTIQASFAQLLVELGHCSDPSTFRPGKMADLLDHHNPVERAVFNIAQARGGRMDFRRHFGDTEELDSPLHPKFWPGWPNDATRL